jgi:acyl-CoA thioesterase I
MIETGANDGLRGLDPDSTAANIRAIVTKVKRLAPNARVMIVQMEAPPNFGAAYTAKFHAIFPTVAKESGATLVPFLLDSVAGIGKLNQPDGIHPTAAGAKIVARNVWRSLGPEILRLDRLRHGG